LTKVSTPATTTLPALHEGRIEMALLLHAPEPATAAHGRHSHSATYKYNENRFHIRTSAQDVNEERASE
jgi:hypothetical protein